MCSQQLCVLQLCVCVATCMYADIKNLLSLMPSLFKNYSFVKVTYLLIRFNFDKVKFFS